MNQDQLKRQVMKARDVFERHAPEIDTTLFSTFPRGCCGNVSLLLGNWLFRQGFRNTKVVLAENENGDSHSWLIVNDRIIDITADQFADQGYGIFPLSSAYHSSYLEQTEDSLDVEGALAEALEKFVAIMNRDP